MSARINHGVNSTGVRSKEGAIYKFSRKRARLSTLRQQYIAGRQGSGHGAVCRMLLLCTIQVDCHCIQRHTVERR